MHENFDYVYQITEMDELKKNVFANKLKDCNLKLYLTICHEVLCINRINPTIESLDNNLSDKLYKTIRIVL